MTEFTDTFAALRKILTPYRAKTHVKTDTPTNLYLEASGTSGKPQLFAAVQVKKSYVSFHLFPLYTNPALLEDVPDALKTRMQGKSCFNFKKADAAQLAELKTLTAKAWKLAT